MPGWDSWRKNMFYSFQAGAVHFTGVNTESPVDVAEVGPHQLDWIKHDLQTTHASAEQTNSGDAPGGALDGSANWTIVYGHRPYVHDRALLRIFICPFSLGFYVAAMTDSTFVDAGSTRTCKCMSPISGVIEYSAMNEC